MIKLKAENRKLTLAIAMLRKGITEPDYSPYEKEIEKLKLIIIELEKRPQIDTKNPHHKIIKKLQKEVN